MLRLIIFFLGCILSFPSLADVTVSEISSDSAEFIISEGPNSVELSISFDSATGLTESSIGVDSYAFSVTDPNLLGRLPAGVVPVAEFPVMIVIEPPADGGLSFKGAAEVSIHTSDLEFAANYRVFKAPPGGVFEDVTAEHGAGSYRARCRTGNFSEWMIVIDNRDPADVIALKYQRLSDGLSSSGIIWWLVNRLQNLLSLSRLYWLWGNDILAIVHLDTLIGLINSLQGRLIGNVWSASNHGADNVAGDLLGLSTTLRFSLSQG